MSDLVIGLTVLAVGTSLPELASCVAAARKGEHDIALGNVLGSNLFNTLAVVGIAGAISPMQLAPEVITRDWPVMAGLTVLAVRFRLGISRPPGPRQPGGSQHSADASTWPTRLGCWCPRPKPSDAFAGSLQTLAHGGVPQHQPQLGLHAVVAQPPRLVHEAQQHGRQLGLRLGARDAGRAGQAVQIGREIDIVAHLQLGVVAHVQATLRPAAPQGQHAGPGQIVRMDVVGEHVVLLAQHRCAALQARPRGVPPSRSGA